MPPKQEQPTAPSFTQADLTTILKEIGAAASVLSTKVNELASLNPIPVVGNHSYMFQQHLQDALNRVSNMSVIVQQKSAEAIEGAVDAAVAAGNLKIVEG